MTYKLFIDKPYSDLFSKDRSNKLILMPNVNSKNKWTLETSDFSNINSKIVQLNKKIAKAFANKIYNKILNINTKESHFIYYGFGTAITFLLADRLYRINKLLKNYDIKEIEIDSEKYIFNKNISFLEFYYSDIEKNPLFNQWVLSRIINKIPKDDFLNKGIRLLNFKFSKKAFVKSCYVLFYRISARFYNKSNKTFFHSFGYLSDLFSQSKLINSEKIISELPAFSPIWFSFFKKDIVNNNSFELINDISNFFKEFILETGESNNLPDYIYQNISKMVVSLQPNVVNRDLITNIKWVTNIFNKHNGNFYLTDSTTSNALSCLYIYGARATNKKVIGCQHSAWGGYFANGSLVSELLINGSHYYITSGWDFPDKKLSYWEIDNIILPSPLYSKINDSIKSNRLATKKKSKKILLCPGFLNRFPSIYNSNLRIDIIEEWSIIIKNIIKTCINHGFKVELKFYKESFKQEYSSIVDDWLSVGNLNEVFEYSNHDFRIRNILKENDYEFIVWDLLAGGFFECINSGNNALALSSFKYHEYYNEDSLIEDLIESKILFTDSDDLALTLKEINKNDFWFKNPKRLNRINSFKKKYSLISNNYEKEWNEFLIKINSNNINIK